MGTSAHARRHPDSTAAPPSSTPTRVRNAATTTDGEICDAGTWKPQRNTARPVAVRAADTATVPTAVRMRRGRGWARTRITTAARATAHSTRVTVCPARGTSGNAMVMDGHRSPGSRWAATAGI